MFLEHQYYVRYIGFLSNFVLILKYFFLLLKLYIYDTVMRVVTWFIWLLLKNSRAISVQLAVFS